MKNLIIAALLLGTSLTTATVAKAEFVTVDGPRRIIDGDTFQIGQERIRLEGPDSPELRKARCPHEREVAIQAANRLKALIGSGPLLIERHGLDKYGRTLALVYAAGPHEIGEMLIAEGLALAWAPGRQAWHERAKFWCPGFTESSQSRAVPGHRTESTWWRAKRLFNPNMIPQWQ